MVLLNRGYLGVKMRNYNQEDPNASARALNNIAWGVAAGQYAIVSQNAQKAKQEELLKLATMNPEQREMYRKLVAEQRALEDAARVRIIRIYMKILFWITMALFAPLVLGALGDSPAIGAIMLFVYVAVLCIYLMRGKSNGKRFEVQL